VGESLPISAVMITRDAEETIEAALRSLAPFSEVIVYDSGSQDRTLDLARRFPNVAIHRGEFLGFGRTKNHAAALATHDWVLSIDSDEQVSVELLQSIRAADISDSHIGYEVLRRNFFMGKAIKHAGWGDDWLLRLFNRRHAAFTDVPVHENVRFNATGHIRRLSGFLDHDAARDLGNFLVKVNRYSELRRAGKRRILRPFAIILRAVWAFWRTYLLQLGVLEGWRGLVIAWSNANGVFFKYMKAYADAAVVDERASESGELARKS
jgi:glycosyltransferase involved in cell wall biosynthesis